MLNIKWSKYIPQDKKPHAKQLAFLSLPHVEALYGGSAGGGKSEALLFAALQYVDVPKYSAIIFRRTIEDAELPNSILSRAKVWLSPYLNTGEVKFKNNTFTFPSGAKVAFGYLKNQGDQYRYQSSEYQTIIFDELTQFYETEYEYLFSRLRRTDQNPVPLRMRSGTNPGGTGHAWVKNRFRIQFSEEKGIWIGTNGEAPFIPARKDDNPYLDPQYKEMLQRLGKTERERLLNGDWNISEDALHEKHWYDSRYTTKHGDQHYHLLSKEKGLRVFNKEDLFLFTTIDCAASVKTGVKGRSYSKTKPQASWSVIATWGLTPEYDLLWLDNWRMQTSIPILVDYILENHKRWNPLYNIVEKNGPGEGVYQFAEKKGLPINAIHTLPDKVQNATGALLRAEKGMIWLPTWAPWLPALEDELFSWTGHPDELDDQIDVLSNAANEAMRIAMGSERNIQLRSSAKRAVPFSRGGSVTHTRHTGRGYIRSGEYTRGPITNPHKSILPLALYPGL